MKALEISGLRLGQGSRRLVEGVNFGLDHGQVLGLVGHSGAGKTLLASALCGLLPESVRVTSGTIRLHGEYIDPNNPRSWRGRRGREVFMIFQSPASALNPTVRVGSQIAEALTLVRGWDRRQARIQAGRLLEAVGVSAAMTAAYPFELSGGMQQRALIAAALGLRPQVLIADEPTAGLDPANQGEVLRLLLRMQQRHHTAILLISHDLRTVSRLAERMAGLFQTARGRQHYC